MLLEVQGEGVELAQEWPDLLFSKSEVRRAGEVLRRWFLGEMVSESDVEKAQEVLSNWRSVHGFVRNTAAMGLRSRAGRLGLSAEIASRTKARNSIYLKLAERADLKLAALGDIAGARAVVTTLGDQDQLVDAYREADEVRRVLDYRDGKESGYRAVHIDLVLEDKHTAVPDRRRRRVEIQVRTKAQHEWADFVESLARRTGYRLKQGIGPAWLLRSLAGLSDAYARLDEAVGGASVASVASVVEQDRRSIEDRIEEWS